MPKYYSEALKLTIPFVVVLSVVYELFYFQGMGWRLSQAPLTTQDFLRGWVVWGAVALPLLFGFLSTIGSQHPFESVREAHRDSNTTGQIHAESRKSIRCLSKLLFCSMLAFSGALLLVFVIAGETHLFVLQTGFSVFWLALMMRYFFMVPEPEFVPIAKLIGGGILTLFSLAGLEAGSKVLSEEFQLPDVTTQQTSRIAGIDESVVRIFDQWTLVRLSPKHYAWINHQSGETIEFHPGRLRYQGLRCIFNEDYCYFSRREEQAYQ